MRRLAAVLLVLTLVAVACGDNGGDDISADATTTTESSAETTTTDAAEPDERVVVLGEEFLLADVMALGVTPIAATATIDDTFRGVEHDTSDIEVLNATEPNIEQLASLEPDQIIAHRYVVDALGIDVLEGIAPTIVVEYGDWREVFLTLAEDLDATEEADALLADYDETVAAVDEELADDIEVTMATIYPGEALAVWVDGPVNIPATFIDAGVTLSPGAGTYPDESNGRAYISTELMGDLDSETLVMLQSDAVEGEADSVADIEASDRWAQLPAVQNDSVIVLDRLGYPGVEGRIRLAEELPGILG